MRVRFYGLLDMVGVVGSSPIVPTKSERGRTYDPFFIGCLSGLCLSESMLGSFTSSDSGPVPVGRKAPAIVRQAYLRIASWLIPTHVTFGRGHH